MKKLGIYARQSREKETTGSIDDQVLNGKLKAQMLDYDYELYIDRGKSAAGESLDNRPEMQRMLNDIDLGVISAVYVYDESRLTRNYKNKEDIKKILKDRKILLYTSIDGIVNFEDANNELMSDIRTIFARKLITDTTAKIKGVLRNRVIAGKAHGGPLKPYGYTSDPEKMLIIDEEESVIIKQIFNYSLSGLGSGKIAEVLNSNGIPTRGNKVLKNGINLRSKLDNKIRNIPKEKIKWAGNTILSILKNPLYKGERIYKGESFDAPAIVEPHIWDDVQTQIEKNKNRTGKVKHQYLLKELCFCGRCGSTFVGRTRENKKDHYYYCFSKRDKQKKCGIRSLNIDYLDEVVWYAVSNSNTIASFALAEIEKRKNPTYKKSLIAEKTRLERELNEEKEGKKKIIELCRKGILTDEEIESNLKDIKNAIIQIEKKIAELRLKIEHEVDIENAIDEIAEFQKQLDDIKFNATFELKHVIIRLLVEKITIDFDDALDQYIIELLVRIPGGREMQTLFLNKGQEPNLLNYSPDKDKYYQNYLKRSNNLTSESPPYSIRPHR